MLCPPCASDGGQLVVCAVGYGGCEVLRGGWRTGGSTGNGLRGVLACEVDACCGACASRVPADMRSGCCAAYSAGLAAGRLLMSRCGRLSKPCTMHYHRHCLLVNKIAERLRGWLLREEATPWTQVVRQVRVCVVYSAAACSQAGAVTCCSQPRVCNSHEPGRGHAMLGTCGCKYITSLC
jgi:hypothetical protein